MKKKLCMLLVSAVAFASQPVFAQNVSNKDIVDTAVRAGDFKTLATALEAAGLVDALKGKGPFTVFAPTDAAFAKLPKGTVAELLKPVNKAKLQAVLKYHVVQGRADLSTALGAGKAETLQGGKVSIAFKDGKVRINDAKLLNADIKTSNGVIHVIDSVLLPEEPSNDIAGVAKKAGKFNTLLAAVEAAGLSSVLTGNDKVTVLAPTDAAFKALPKGTVEALLKPENRSKLANILSLHVVKGEVSAGTALNAKVAKAVSGESLNFAIDGGVFKVNGVKIVTTDIKCDNGVIHVIDAVLLPSEKAAMSPARSIEMALDKGVPAFNHGNPAKCATIYMQCMEGLVSNSNVDAHTRKMLSAVVEKARGICCPSDRAWALRGGLDKAYLAVSSVR